MPDEKPKIDVDLTKEFQELIDDQERKINPEERIRKALWALEVLKNEKKINSGTIFSELIKILEDRKEELRQSDAYAADASRGKVMDEVGNEFNSLAKKEVETSKRLLSYMEAAWGMLMLLQITEAYDPGAPLSQVTERLKGELEIMESAVGRREENQRNREG